MNIKRTFSLIALLVAALVLAACAGETAQPTAELPTLDPSIVTATAETSPDASAATATPLDMPTREPTVNSPFPTLDVIVYPTLDGTPFPTNDPSIASLPTEEIVPPPPGFDRIVLIRTGGPTLDDGTTANEVITILSDGTVTRGEGQGRISAETSQRIADLIDQSQFFTVDATFLGPVPAQPPLPFLYRITVTSGSYERQINAQEGFMSVPIQQLIGTVLEEGMRVSNP